MMNHPKIGAKISDKDKLMLRHLKDIKSKLHDHGYGFDIIFEFEHNPYFEPTIIKKTYIL